MSLMDLNIRQIITDSTISYLQAEYRCGLYDEIGEPIDGPNDESFCKDTEHH